MYGDTQNKTVKQYAEEKVKMLQEEFKLHLSDEEIYQFYEAKREIDIDRLARNIFINNL